MPTLPLTGLTVRQREFVRLYLLKGAAYSAYIQAFGETGRTRLAALRWLGRKTFTIVSKVRCKTLAQ